MLPANCNYDITTAAAPGDGLPVITGHVVLAGAHNTAIRRRAAATFRLFDVAAGGSLSLTSITVDGGHSTGLGGGIQNAGTVVLSQAVFTNNTGSNGGALANNASGTMRVSDTVFERNAATSVGGGAIINFADLTVTGSILSRNTAPINGGAVNTQPGGTTRLTSVTISENTSVGLGGGLSNLGTTVLTGSTVTHNQGSGGGGIATGNTNVTLRATVVRNNTPDNCNPLNTIPGCVN